MTAIGTRLVEANAAGTDTEPVTEITYSNPSPDVRITYLSISNPQVTSDGLHLVGQIMVSGTLDSAVADVIDGDLGKIEKVDFYLNGSLLPIASFTTSNFLVVSKVANPDSFTKPYDYSGAFAGVITAELLPGANTLTAVATEKVYGVSGFCTWEIPLNVTPPGGQLGFPSDEAGRPIYTNAQIMAGQSTQTNKSDPGTMHRYAVEVMGPGKTLDALGHLETTGGTYNLINHTPSQKYYLAKLAEQTSQVVKWKPGNVPPGQAAKPLQQFRLASTPTVSGLGNGLSEIRYSVERAVYRYGRTGGRNSWELAGQYTLVVPTEQVPAWKTFIRGLYELITSEDQLQDKLRDVALLDASLRAVPFGTLAIDVNDGNVNADTWKRTAVDGVLTVTPMLLARPVSAVAIAARTGVATERVVVASYTSLLRGGSTDVATSFGDGATFVPVVPATDVVKK